MPPSPWALSPVRPLLMPAPADKQDPSLLTVTATHAVFHLDESRYVPASVLGYVMPHASLQRRFENVTSKACKTCLPCSSERLDCYLLDSSGYVLASKSALDTGRFFGEIEGAVMAEMVKAGLFTARKVYDYQALCSEDIPLDSAASILLTVDTPRCRAFPRLLGGPTPCF